MIAQNMNMLSQLEKNAFIGNHNPPNTAKPIVTILAKALVF